MDEMGGLVGEGRVGGIKRRGCVFTWYWDGWIRSSVGYGAAGKSGWLSKCRWLRVVGGEVDAGVEGRVAVVVVV